MGYSVTVSARSRQLRDRTATFLADVFRPWADIVDEEGPSDFDGPLLCGKLGIGFDYNTEGGPEWEYVYAFMRWLALKIGRRRSHFQARRFDEPVPHIVAPRGSQPVLLNIEWPKPPSEPYQCCVVDRFGLLTCSRPARDLAWYHIPEGSYERISATHQGKTSEAIREALIESGIERARVVLQYIRAEIARLDVLWPL